MIGYCTEHGNYQIKTDSSKPCPKCKCLPLISDRGIPLVLQDVPQNDTLTVENYGKWYDLYLVTSNGLIIKYGYESYVDIVNMFPGTIWGDHVINPDFVCMLAEHKGFDVDERSYEIIVGRWVIEHEGKYR